MTSLNVAVWPDCVVISDFTRSPGTPPFCLPSVPLAAAGAPQRGGAGEGRPEGEQREADQQVGGRLAHTLHDNPNETM